MEIVLLSLVSVLVTLVIGGFGWLRADVKGTSGRVDRLSGRVDNLSDRVSKVEAILEGRQ